VTGTASSYTAERSGGSWKITGEGSSVTATPSPRIGASVRPARLSLPPWQYSYLEEFSAQGEQRLS
jgi:hypothetical protein